MAISTLLVRSYCANIYLGGSTKLADIEIARPTYVVPVMQRAADYLTIDDVDYALDHGFITIQEHADTLDLKGPEDPQYKLDTMWAEVVIEDPTENI